MHKSYTRLYTIWSMMRQRCYNPKATGYQYYGARGITVCERWRNSFEDFSADMGEPPTKSHTLDRRENDMGYSPENCRWATVTEQSSNRRSKMVEFKGETRSISQWAARLRMKTKILHSRLERYHWTVERAFTAPVRFRRK